MTEPKCSTSVVMLLGLKFGQQQKMEGQHTQVAKELDGYT